MKVSDIRVNGSGILKWTAPILLMLIFGSCRTNTGITLPGTMGNDGSLKLSDAQIQLANIKTADIRTGSIGRMLSLTGVLKVNEQTAYTVSSRIPGRVEKIYFKNSGDYVKIGDPLYDLYSEELVSAQKEYFRLQSNNWNFNARYEPSLSIEDRMLVMGLTRSQINEIGKSGKIHFTVTINSPATGKIRTINITEGQFVNKGDELFEFAEDNTLWIEAQVYPDEIQYLKNGMPAIVVIPSSGVAPVLCRIVFINPSFETGKNITLIRALINNEENALHPGMFATLNLRAQTDNGMIIPASSVISSSSGDRVWVREADGSFSGRNVTTGLQSGDSILVLSGLNPAEMVVTAGAYLLESELILRGGTGTHGETLKQGINTSGSMKENAGL